MFDDLLPYYNAELRFMREMAGEFARANPKIAGRLRLSSNAVEDPHVGRLIEAFAFLAARTRLKLDDDFPELTETMLGILHPHLLLPHPSMSIVQLAPPVGLTGESIVPRGTEIATEPVAGEALRYRTTAPVALWPVELTRAELLGLPLAAPRNPRAPDAVGALRLTLACTHPEMTFGQLGLDSLRFHIHAEARVAHILYELIVGGTLSIAAADSAVDAAPVLLDRPAIRRVGLDEAEASVPLAPAADPGHLLMTEYFAFPEKFLFFDIAGLSAKTLRDGGRTLDLFLYFDRFDAGIERLVSRDRFRLFCAPAVNLFRQRAEPIRLLPGRFEHRVVPDARREAAIEPYAIERVAVVDRAGEPQPFHPFYGIGRERGGGTLRYWHASRRTNPRPEGGDDLFLSTIDTSGRTVADPELIATVDLTCTNRSLPRQLPFGEGRPALTVVDAPGRVGEAQFIVAPTDPVRPRRGAGALWRLVSHLALNHLSIGDPAVALAAVKELLALHDHVEGSPGRVVVERLSAVEGQPATARAPAGGHIVFLHGTDVTLEFDDRRLSGSGAFLLGSLLETVFAGRTAINTFSRTRLRLKGEARAWQQWPARTGTRAII